MKDNILIIGDIAGRYDELIQLIDNVKKEVGEFSIISVGDLVDRGKDSKKVVKYFMYNDDAFAVKGNHEDLMVDYMQNHFIGGAPKYNIKYGWSVWKGNGGKDTLFSYGCEDNIPKSHVTYLNRLPICIEHSDAFGNIVITHAPINPVFGLDRLKSMHIMDDNSLCWNRGGTSRDVRFDIQFHGHNANRNIQYNTDKLGTVSVNVDTSRGKKLSGVLWPSMGVFEVDYNKS